MSIELQIRLKDLLKVDGIEVKAVMNTQFSKINPVSDLDQYMRHDDVPADLGYAKWCMEADTLMKLPNYFYWRSYTMMTVHNERDDMEELLVCFPGVGSSSDFVRFFERMCIRHDLKYNKV